MIFIILHFEEPLIRGTSGESEYTSNEFKEKGLGTYYHHKKESDDDSTWKAERELFKFS